MVTVSACFRPCRCGAVFTIVCIGILNTTMSWSKYLVSSETWSYLLNMALYMIFFLPGVFQTNRLKGAVNGSLWTIPIRSDNVCVYSIGRMVWITGETNASCCALCGSCCPGPLHDSQRRLWKHTNTRSRYTLLVYYDDVRPLLSCWNCSVSLSGPHFLNSVTVVVLLWAERELFHTPYVSLFRL